MLERLVDFCIDRRSLLLCLIGLFTVPLLVGIPSVRIVTDLADLLPVGHDHVAVHERFKASYGGANTVTIVIEVEEGDIFRTDFLSLLRTATLELRGVDGVNSEQVLSLASKKLRDVRTTSDGWEVAPLMFPDVPQDREALAELRRRVLGNDLVYGGYVSHDLKAALISVDFYDHLIQPAIAFQQVRALTERLAAPGIRIRVIGEPIVAGWVAHYLGQSLLILAASLAVLGIVLFLLMRTWRAVLVPILSGVASGAWALGFAGLLGIAFDPLVIVVALLVTARAISHSVQLVVRFDDEIAGGAATAIAAAKAAMRGLFKPGMLGVVTDAACMAVVMLMPIPLLQKMALVGSFWMMTIALSAVIMTPMLLARTPIPLRHAHRLDALPCLERLLAALARSLLGSNGRLVVAAAAVAIVAAGGYALANLTIGDAQPGSAVLDRESALNEDAEEINRRFAGVHRMFVVLEGGAEGAIKDPAALQSMLRFQRHMEVQPGVVTTLSIADLVEDMRRVLHGGNRRYEELGRTQRENAELLYLLAAGSDDSDMARFVDAQLKSASITLFLHDQRAETLRTTLEQIAWFVARNPFDGFAFLFAGGTAGIAAAIDQVILDEQFASIALAMAVVMLCCGLVYRSFAVGVYFAIPVLLANTLTFGFMAWQGIGLHIHVLPVAALGIGLGIDYAFYVVDAIREGVGRGMPLEEAVEHALRGAGKGVLVTVGVLVAGVALWSWSSLRFQSEMALLIGVWLCIAAASALVLMPALVTTFKPGFIFSAKS